MLALWTHQVGDRPRLQACHKHPPCLCPDLACAASGRLLSSPFVAAWLRCSLTSAAWASNLSELGQLCWTSNAASRPHPSSPAAVHRQLHQAMNAGHSWVAEACGAACQQMHAQAVQAPCQILATNACCTCGLLSGPRWGLQLVKGLGFDFEGLTSAVYPACRLLRGPLAQAYAPSRACCWWT